MYLESVHILSSERWIFTRRHPFKLHPGEEVEHHLHLCCLPITTSSPPSVLTFNTSFNFVCFCTWCKWNVDSMSGVFLLVSCSAPSMLLHLWLFTLYHYRVVFHSAVDGLGGCLWFGTITNTFAVNILEHVISVYVHTSVGYTPGS